MGRHNLAMRTAPVTRGYQTNVVPFDNDRRKLHIEPSSARETRLSAVVLRLPLMAGSRAAKRRTDAQTAPLESNADRLDAIDYVVAFLLFLSTMTGPVLVWTLLSS
jgi:hypothetical protein